MKDIKGLHAGLFEHYAVQLREIAKLSGRTILEVGPRAVVHDYLVWSGYEVTTLDIDPTRKPDVVADIRTLPFVDQKFDIALCADVIEHLPRSDAPYAIKELRRIARTILISVPWRRRIVARAAVKIPTLREVILTIPVARRPLCQGHRWEIECQSDVKSLAKTIGATRTFRVRDRQYFVA